MVAEMQVRRRRWLLPASIAASLALMTLAFYAFVQEHSPPDGGRNLLTIDEPAPILAFQVADGGGLVLWRIEAAEPKELSYVRYGVVPTGYRQVTPHFGAPRPFSVNETLVTETITPDRHLVHYGSAVGAAAFAGGVWRSEPRASTR
jgi:hypothetical protein